MAQILRKIRDIRPFVTITMDAFGVDGFAVPFVIEKTSL